MTGDRLMRIGIWVTVVGLLAALIAMSPLVIPELELPGVWWFLAMITGVGLALVIAGLARSARERRRSQHGLRDRVFGEDVRDRHHPDTGS